MKYTKRKKETIKNMLVLLIGIVCLHWITINLINVEASVEFIELEEIKAYDMEIEERNIELRIDDLYENRGQVINEEEIEEVITNVLGASYVPRIQIESKKTSYGVVVTYDETNHRQNLSKPKREQVALVDACLIMSLFNDVDVVTIRNIQEAIDEEKVIYRLDLEDYFQMSLGTHYSEDTFASVANEFLNSERVNEYWNVKHPFDSQLGEAVEKFYKCNFPSKWDTLEDALAGVDETLEETLKKQYGYKFWVQGLNYDHPAMNYYAAYKLIEYYGNNNLDEILLELASCKNRSKDLKVQQACQFAMNVLSKSLKLNEVVIFTTYNELELQGGERLYGIMENHLVEMAVWQGEKPGGFEVMSVSSDKRSVLCKIHTSDQDYLYMIPVDAVGGYKVDETTVQKGEKIISRELTNMMKEVALNEEMGDEVVEEIDKGNIQSRWLFRDVLILFVHTGESFVYDANKNSLSSEALFSQEFDTDYLIQGLKEKFENLTVKEVSAMSDTCEIQEIAIDTEKLFAYEYESKKQKNRALLKEKQEITSLQNQWSKGKIHVIYEGNDTEIIRVLNLLMAE